jgi:small subunit ribosomal protein S10
VHKESREQFQLATHMRLIDIYFTDQSTIDELMKLELPRGVEIEIKV